MAVNKPTGDNARMGAVKKRTQLNNPLTKTSTNATRRAASSWRSKRARRNSRAFGRKSDGQAIRIEPKASRRT